MLKAAIMIHISIYFPFCQPPQSHDHTVGDIGGSHFSLYWPSPTITAACHLQPTERKHRPDHQAGGKCHGQGKWCLWASPSQRPTWIF